MNRLLLSCLGAVLWTTVPAWGQASDRLSSAEAAIRQSAPAYVRAFNARDSKALADQWSPDAVYLNRSTGEEVIGREAIASQFDALFKAQPDLKLDVRVDSIRFLSPNVAVEEGASTYVSPTGAAEAIDYTAVYVHRDGRWLLDRVTDAEAQAAASHFEHLKELEWMVGTWVDQADEQTRIEFDCQWAKNQNFLVRAFRVTVDDRVDLSGMQIIGWDGSAQTIRSWTFDSEGGFAEGTWTNRGDRWFIQNKGVLADGQTLTLVNVVKPIDESSFTWETVQRTVGGDLLPNIDAVTIVRR